MKITAKGEIIITKTEEEEKWEKEMLVGLRKRLKKAGLKSFYPRIPIEK